MSDHEEDGLGQGAWSTYRRLVLAELRRSSEELRDLREMIREMRTDIAMLKVKAGLWGAGGGLLVALSSALLYVARGG